MIFRELNTAAMVIPFVSGGVRDVDLGTAGFGQWVRVAVRGDWTYDYTSGTVTLATTPPGSAQPIAQLRLWRDPDMGAGALVLDTVAVWLAHLITIPFKRRMPKATNPAFSTSDADFSTYLEIFLPLSLDDGVDSALQVVGSSKFRLEIKWNTLAAIAAASVGAAVATVADDNTENIRAEVTVGEVIAEPGDVISPLMQCYLTYTRVPHDAATFAKPLPNVQVGDTPLISAVANVDNSVFAAVPGSPNCRIFMGRGAATPEFEYLPDELRRKNESDYGIRDGDGYAYAYFFDFVRRYKGADRIPPIANTGGALTLGLRSSTPTGGAGSYLDCLTLAGRWTPQGRARMAARAKVS